MAPANPPQWPLPGLSNTPLPYPSSAYYTYNYLRQIADDGCIVVGFAIRPLAGNRFRHPADFQEYHPHPPQQHWPVQARVTQDDIMKCTIKEPQLRYDGALQAQPWNYRETMTPYGREISQKFVKFIGPFRSNRLRGPVRWPYLEEIRHAKELVRDQARPPLIPTLRDSMVDIV